MVIVWIPFYFNVFRAFSCHFSGCDLFSKARNFPLTIRKSDSVRLASDVIMAGVLLWLIRFL